MRRERHLMVGILLIFPMLACMTNTPIAQVATPPPTRTPLPTFTNTPLPATPTPIPTPTDTPLVTDTPTPTVTPPVTATPEPVNTPTPVPTDTPVPPTNTPVPHTPTPIPPTNTPVPTPTAPAVSVLPTPTFTPEPDTPPGRYEIRSTEGMKNCFHVAVFGRIREKGSDTPVQFVTVEVRGDKDPYKGPYRAKTNKDGDYTVLISDLKDDVDGVDFEVKVVGGAGVISEDKYEWRASGSCEGDNVIQVMKVNWDYKS